MKPKTEPSLEELKKEIEELKEQKKRKLQIATSTTERNKLLREINELDAVKSSPNALRNFGKTFKKGMQITGRKLWKGITTASRNIDTNAPELREFGKTMTYQPKPSRKPPMDLDGMTLPRQPKKTTKPRQPKRTIKKSVSKKKTKKSKSKKRKQKARKMVYNQPKQSANSWELP